MLGSKFFVLGDILEKQNEFNVTTSMTILLNGQNK